ncbi:MAG TPA: FTR1 family protein [Caulobacteraceae bacterium]|nr:FTR1 family protein [Caulobacteraceae bacterium]
MLAALVIVFREVFEAGLIVGIVLAATEGVAGRARFIAGGIVAGIAGAALVALFADVISNAFSGVGQEAFNAAVLSLAVAMLAWHVLWMSAHAREMSRDFRALGAAVASGQRTLWAMAAVVAVAILREGSEVVLFLFGIAASGGESPVAMLTGSAAGLAAGAAVSFLVYRGLLAIPPGRLFGATNLLVTLLAAGMAGQAAVFLHQAGVLPALGDQLWDTSAILPDDGVVGRALHVLVGYSDRPSGVQLAAWAAVLAALTLGARFVARPPRAAAGAA